MNKALDLLNENDLTPDLKMLCDVCGIDTVKILLEHLNGLSFYIPKLSHLNSLIEKYMKSFPDKMLKEIARELGVSVPYLKNLRNNMLKN